MMPELHPFAKYIAILGRGKTLSRSLTLNEADEAMGMIIDGVALPEQLGCLHDASAVSRRDPRGSGRFCQSHQVAP